MNSSVIAIDPGPTESAYVIMERGTITHHQKVSNEAMLSMLYCLHSMASNGVHLVLEQVASFGMPVGADVFETVFWSGRFCQRWDGPFTRIKRHQVKMHLCGNMRAKDANIRQALIDKLGAPGKKKSPGATYGISGDCWSALALAVTFLETISDQHKEAVRGVVAPDTF